MSGREAWKAGLIAAISMVVSACSTLNKGAETASGGVSSASAQPGVAGQSSIAAQPGAAGTSGASGVVPLVSREYGGFERNDIKSLDKIVIRLSFADVSLVSGDEYRKGHVKIEKTAGAATCRVAVNDSEDRIEITEPSAKPPLARVSAVAKAVKSSIPVVANCRFTVEIGLREAAETTVELVRGTLLAEKWDEPIEAKMEWGDIDVGSIGPLTVHCGHCMLSGEGIDGPLHYTLESGNVGLAGLTESVEGQTLGDTVLKWRRLKADSNVKLMSHAGDVILFFPDAVPLSIDLHAPRGEVSSRFQTGNRGVPVSVTAELGNVQVYRATKEAKKE